MHKAARLVNLENFKKLAQQEVALQPLSSEDIQRVVIKSSYNSYKFTMKKNLRVSFGLLSPGYVVLHTFCCEGRYAVDRSQSVPVNCLPAF
jgi:hypothetical protein